MDARDNNKKNLIRRRMRMRNTGIYSIPRHSERLDAVKKIQRWIKMKLWKIRKRKTISERVIMIQKIVRGYNGRKEAKRERHELEMLAAEMIQIVYRSYLGT